MNVYPFVQVTGFDELDHILSRIGGPSAQKMGKAAVGRMGQVYAKTIRKYIPKSIASSLNMASDKGIGSRNTRAKLSTITTAKAGVSVGGSFKRAKKWQKGLGAAGGANGKRPGRKGVGVSARNLMWFALGTKDRFTGSKRIRGKYGRLTNKRKSTGNPVVFTGRINERIWGGFVQAGAKEGKGPAMEAAKQKIASMIDKEAAAARTGNG